MKASSRSGRLPSSGPASVPGSGGRQQRIAAGRRNLCSRPAHSSSARKGKRQKAKGKESLPFAFCLFPPFCLFAFCLFLPCPLPTQGRSPQGARCALRSVSADRHPSCRLLGAALGAALAAFESAVATTWTWAIQDRLDLIRLRRDLDGIALPLRTGRSCRGRRVVQDEGRRTRPLDQASLQRHVIRAVLRLLWQQQAPAPAAPGLAGRGLVGPALARSALPPGFPRR